MALQHLARAPTAIPKALGFVAVKAPSRFPLQHGLTGRRLAPAARGGGQLQAAGSATTATATCAAIACAMAVASRRAALRPVAFARRHRRHLATVHRPAAAAGEAAASEEAAAESGGGPEDEEKPSTLGGRFKAWWRKNAKLDRKQMSKLGLACLLSYGFVSNASYMLILHAAVYSAMQATGASPLADRAALKQFGVAYAGLWMVLNVIRPLRFALAVALSPAFDRLVNAIERGLRCKRRSAIAVTVFLVNVVGTFSLLFGGLFLVSAICGVPLDVSQLGTLVQAGKAARSAA